MPLSIVNYIYAPIRFYSDQFIMHVSSVRIHLYPAIVIVIVFLLPT